jgi:hypothetical protein
VKQATITVKEGTITGWQTPFGLVALVPPRWLTKDSEYQREYSEETARAIAFGDSSDPAKWPGWKNERARPVNCRVRNSRLFVTNGQHTAEAATLAGVEEILVIINNGSPSRATEAQEYVAFQRSVKPIGAYDTYRASLVAGDGDALVVRKVTSELGVIPAARQEGDPMKLTSITAARDLAGRGTAIPGSEVDEQAFRDVLEIALEAWTDPDDLHRFRSDLLHGIDMAIDLRDKETVLENARRYSTSDALYQEANAEARGRGYKIRSLIRDKLAVVPRRQKMRRGVVHAE